MEKLHIITPVKDSWETTRQTVEAIAHSEILMDYVYTIYNDFSSDETTAALAEITKKHEFELINLASVTDHPSPNYLLILQMAQQRAVAENAHLLIVESDVVVEKNTIQKLMDALQNSERVGMVASVTVDKNGDVNFPYLYAQNYSLKDVETKKRLSFCCTVLSASFLKAFDFKTLNPEKSWYDVFISHQSLELGFKNCLLMTAPVLHQPHSSRPWKQLKYTHPLKYYWLKYTKGLDKI